MLLREWLNLINHLHIKVFLKYQTDLPEKSNPIEQAIVLKPLNHFFMPAKWTKV